MSFSEKVSDAARIFFRTPVVCAYDYYLPTLHKEGKIQNLFVLYRTLRRSEKGLCSIITPLLLHPSDLGLNPEPGRNDGDLMTPPITGKIRIDGNTEYVDLKIGDRTISVPRQTSENPQGIISVSSTENTNDVETLNVQVFSPNDKNYDRGLAWITTGEKPYFLFVLKPDYNLKLFQLIKNHLTVCHTVVRTLQKISDYKVS